MTRRPPNSTRTDTLFPYTTLFRSLWPQSGAGAGVGGQRPGREADLLQAGDDLFHVVGIASLPHHVDIGPLGRHVIEQPLVIHLDDVGSAAADGVGDRAEERRVGKECVRTCRSWWSPHHKKKKA